MNAATVGEALRAAGERVDRIDAWVLLSHVVQRVPAYLIAHYDAALDDGQRRCFDALVSRRARGEPVAYLTGEREFFGRTFRITPAVLVPRPETELLSHYFQAELSRQFDAWIWFEETHAVAAHGEAHPHGPDETYPFGL